MRNEATRSLPHAGWPRGKHRLQQLKAKAKTRRALNLESSDNDNKPPYKTAIEGLSESPAFNSSKFSNKARIGPAAIPDKVVALVQGTAEAIVDPKAALKSRATRKTAGKLTKSRPYLSRKADLDFLEANDNLARAKYRRDGEDDKRTAAEKRQTSMAVRSISKRWGDQD
ncbi:hypothetical protein G7Y89_g14899 [Cudoniella acicularis]|uniref:Uncharacterized protein n=1 Tax=Cudoniella acicularis TaxID=354080 RepID=A0A8H4VS73_9HELO|nr:hypothetical protein G7Y89_g14899 [Cudoniella acicularis]